MLFPSAVISPHTSTPSDYMQNGVLITTAGAGSRKVPERVINLIIEIWGGGAGGAGGDDQGPTFNSGGGGGSGAYLKKEITVSPDDMVNFNIGSGGIGGTLSNYSDNATDGGNTTISSSGLTAGGGKKGIPITGGIGGIATGGDINTNGNSGQNGSSESGPL